MLFTIVEESGGYFILRKKKNIIFFCQKIKKDPGTSFQVRFFIEFFDKRFSFVILRLNYIIIFLSFFK